MRGMLRAGPLLSRGSPVIHPRGAARGPSPGRGRVIHPGTTRRLRTHFRGGHRVCMCGPVGDGGEQRGSGGEGDGLDTNILYERMKALRAKEDEENTAVVDAAIERDQAIVAGIRGDAAERPMPSGEARREQNITSSDNDYAALVEHLLSTPVEAMDYEGVRCGPLLTKGFVDYIASEMRAASAQGPAGEDALVELQALEQWVAMARDKQAARDDALRRRKAMAERDPAASPADQFTPSSSPAYPTPVKTVGEKFRILMASAANGVDALRGAIIELARAEEIDESLLALLQANADNARAADDDGRANFLAKVREVCIREDKAARGEQ